MSLDVLHDAIGRIDEDLVEEVDALRRKPHQAVVWIWVRRASVIAACAAVLIVGAFALSHAGLLPPFVADFSVGSLHEYAVDDVNQAVVEYTTPSSGETVQGDEYSYYAQSSESIEESAVTVEIIAWTDTGCHATVLESADDLKNIHVGDTVEIAFTDDILTLFSFDGTTIVAAERAPTPADLPIGTTALLWHKRVECVGDTVTIYAYRISPAYETK